MSGISADASGAAVTIAATASKVVTAQRFTCGVLLIERGSGAPTPPVSRAVYEDRVSRAAKCDTLTFLSHSGALTSRFDACDRPDRSAVGPGQIEREQRDLDRPSGLLQRQ
ncbi:hypothetical protein GCM10027167_56920 [Nocardia heshunensis]